MRPTRSRATAVVDPGSRVFNSATGDVVDGVSITLLDAATGQPAVGEVFSDDGVTAFPTTVVSGRAQPTRRARRFRLRPARTVSRSLRPGTYRLRVEPPPGVTCFRAALRTRSCRHSPARRSHCPAARVAPTSVVAAGEPLQLDVPVDPTTVDVFVSKQANKDVAAGRRLRAVPGGRSERDTAGIVTNGSLIDQLPKGFRYVANSVRINGARAAEPVDCEERHDADVCVAGGRRGCAGRGRVRDRNQRRRRTRQSRERRARDRRAVSAARIPRLPRSRCAKTCSQRKRSSSAR